ncbi:MAG TPA: chemotaxis protein CheB [Pseudomonadales bacterium]|nr:chemotaxis protein CheB [Pseudomonadales bacterium]
MSRPDVRVLVIEDNRVVQHYIAAALKTDKTIQVLSIADNGNTGLELALQLKPDVILLDLFLPGMDGLTIIQHIMRDSPCPIVVLSGELDHQDRDLAFEAQRAGAVSVLRKPQGMEAAQFNAFSQNLCRTVQLMSQVKVTRRWLQDATPFATAAHCEKQKFPVTENSRQYSIVLIGCSTGGPSALYQLLDQLPPTFPFTLVIVQHIEQGFGETLCEWLRKTGCNVRVPENGESLEAGVVYLAPDNQHLVVGPGGYFHRVDNPAAKFTPSVDMLFDSVASNVDDPVCAIILTGMGNDGTAGMQHLYRKGAMTIAEDESSCAVFGMPAAAIKAGVVHRVEPLSGIVDFLRDCADENKKACIAASL